MLLLGVEKENGWLFAEYRLTYRVGWKHICKAVNLAYDYYDNIEILVDDKIINIHSKEEVLKIKEAGKMTIRGISKVVGVPLMITFFNQLQAVRCSVGCVTEEFQAAEYEKFNKSLAQYMDSLEIAMYRQI
ncbi:hypothetical protein HMPREF1983_00600 [Gemella bergeri ATCC 700627]|uniref:Uncharacterized protein n=1 Tax=Gemella bergeri ATCC 700627 TaxID=1321820 RepID=U2Q8U7_9BACL|nr:hypothetical protein [Gemella bergeri]ERK59225.1 hypothetical protein HMPREF1983_00600 [Gemella bergeri ATCC 700627]